MFWLKSFFRRSATTDTAFVVRHTHAGARNPNPWCLLPCVGWLMTPSLLPITPVFSGYLSGYVLILKSFYFSLKFFIVLKKDYLSDLLQPCDRASRVPGHFETFGLFQSAEHKLLMGQCPGLLVWLLENLESSSECWDLHPKHFTVLIRVLFSLKIFSPPPVTFWVSIKSDAFKLWAKMKLMFWVEETDLKRFVWRFLFQSQQHDQRYCNRVQPTCSPVAFNVCFEDGGQTCDLSQWNTKSVWRK